MRAANGPDGAHVLAAELRELALLALDRLDPLLDRVAQGDVACPVCAGVAAVRREHPELATRLVAGAAELAAALRAAVDDAVDDPAADPLPARRVQRVPVDRPGITPRPRTVQHVAVDRPSPVAARAGTVVTPC